VGSGKWAQGHVFMLRAGTVRLNFVYCIVESGLDQLLKITSNKNLHK
jgi:hypothetical protein